MLVDGAGSPKISTSCCSVLTSVGKLTGPFGKGATIAPILSVVGSIRPLVRSNLLTNMPGGC